MIEEISCKDCDSSFYVNAQDNVRICPYCGCDNSKPSKKVILKKKQIAYEIKCNHKFSWSYIYTKNGRKRDIHGSSPEDLKRQVLKMGLPWSDSKVPKAKDISKIWINPNLNLGPPH